MLPQLGEESLQRRGKSTSLNKRKNLHAWIMRKGLLKLLIDIHKKYVNLLSEDMDEVKKAGLKQ